MPPLQKWQISFQAWISLFILGLAFLTIFTYSGLIEEIVGVLFGAILLSLAIRPLADILQRRHIPRGISVIIVYVGLGGLFALMGILLVPVVNTEVARLQALSPNLSQSIVTHIEAIPLVSRLIPSTSSLASTLSQDLTSLVNTLIGALTGVGGFALNIFIVLILAYFLTSEKKPFEKLFVSWLPPKYQPDVRIAIEGLEWRLSRWVWAQVAIALYFSLVFSVGLRLLGIPFAFTIGLVGGVLEIIPYVGGIIALLLALLSALTINPIMMLWVFIYYAIVVEIESHFIAPTFYGRITGIHPGVVLLALLIGGKAAGILGLLYAVPITLVILAIMHEIQTHYLQPETQSNEEAPKKS
jgi:predicted PurR-regulated permease PerM